MTDERREPIWLDARFALAVHDRQLAEHGGASGIRDANALESALSRPVNRWAYGEDELAALTAAYAFGIARNHPFADGNKRTAWVVARTFLRLNGAALSFEQVDAVLTVQALAAGELSEEELADWFRQRIAATSP
ncbi:type II toxin-antitoxin system death-on-curing family toxin [Erythrobacter sp. EC-HK427]|uniref:type II toxin-antitoxin system death-on-curing family toxin n=1 Tax=Erythrobacter sp. EC-HK427 TaxID=2038396 RepID=UPI001251CEB7|nr:type II toxin-antitoxin system death-on-curing family toxin [Erythrobacter sp. EC-HK427]VVT10217.1 Death-on-curing protein [Erythrobacter sp. EC-HK427]